MNLLGEKIRQLREERGLSQEELAEQLDISRQTVSNWENDRATPDAYKLGQLCKALQVSADELLGIGAPAEGERAAEKGGETPSREAQPVFKRRHGRTVIAIVLTAVAAVLVALAAVLFSLPHEKTEVVGSFLLFTPATGGIFLLALAVLILLPAAVLYFKKK